MPSMHPQRHPSEDEWELIRDAGDPASPTCQESRNAVTARYYGMIFGFVRQSGRSVEEAGDLTQGFIADVLLGRNLLAKVDPTRAQLSTLLMHAVRNYVNDRYRYDQAGKRSPAQGTLRRLDDASQNLAAPQPSNPENAFHRAWIRRLIEEAADSLRREQITLQREWAWDVFQSRVLLPMLDGRPRTSLDVLVTRWNLTGQAQVTAAVVRMRHAFVRHLLMAIGATMDDPAKAHEELRRLLMTVERSSP